MNLEEKWTKAVKGTEIIRYRLSPIETFETTDIPYIFLAESAVNVGDTVVRKGTISVHEASILLPRNYPIFEGFNFEQNLEADKDTIRVFLLLRGVSFPSLKYSNVTSKLEIYEGSLEKAAEEFTDRLEREEDVKTGLMVGPEDCWQFSVLIFVGAMVQKSAPLDAKRLLDDLRQRGHL